jgi:hypothetical protein
MIRFKFPEAQVTRVSARFQNTRGHRLFELPRDIFPEALKLLSLPLFHPETFSHSFIHSAIIYQVSNTMLDAGERIMREDNGERAGSRSCPSGAYRQEVITPLHK